MAFNGGLNSKIHPYSLRAILASSSSSKSQPNVHRCCVSSFRRYRRRSSSLPASLPLAGIVDRVAACHLAVVVAIVASSRLLAWPDSWFGGVDVRDLRDWSARLRAPLRTGLLTAAPRAVVRTPIATSRYHEPELRRVGATLLVLATHIVDVDRRFGLHRQVLNDTNIRGLREVAEVVVKGRGMDRDRMFHLGQDLNVLVGSVNNQVTSPVRVYDWAEGSHNKAESRFMLLPS
ncbi:hypothetical protein Syun_014862 [Stephania yunnanensis]|uniref:Uncharacterized protein n=1 Tax=Stephania yunnanensis TaxID=152371 RepID=A0AAP0P965_9MAGN